MSREKSPRNILIFITHVFTYLALYMPLCAMYVGAREVYHLCSSTLRASRSQIIRTYTHTHTFMCTRVRVHINGRDVLLNLRLFLRANVYRSKLV